VPDKNQAVRIARLILAPSQTADRELASFLEDGDSRDVMAKLLRWDDAAVRYWAIAAAEKVYSRDEYTRVLERASRDPDDDVSADAIDRLFNVAPERLKRMSRSIASKLSSDIPSLEKVFWLWSLARLRARDAIPQIEALRANEEAWTKLARVADVVLQYLNRGETGVLEALGGHRDHAHMEELCTLARFVIRSDAARSALKQCVANAPDEECRRECQFSLEKMKEPT
jgi:hypothetical protein